MSASRFERSLPQKVNRTSSSPTPTQTPTSPSSSDFSSSTALQPPSNVTPPALSSVSSASSVTAPNSSIPSLPGDASSVTPPGSSVPPTSSTPTSSTVTPPTSSSPSVSPVTPPSSGGTLTITPLGIDPAYAAWIAKFLILAANLNDAQTKAEMELAFKSGDPTLMASAGLGATIRAAVLSDSSLDNRDEDNLATIDKNIAGMTPLEQVNLRSLEPPKGLYIPKDIRQTNTWKIKRQHLRVSKQPYNH